MSEPPNPTHEVRTGLYLTAALHIVITMAILFWILSEYARYGDGMVSVVSHFQEALFYVVLLQFAYLPIAGLLAWITGHGGISKGLFLGLAVSVFLLPALCFGTALPMFWSQ